MFPLHVVKLDTELVLLHRCEQHWHAILPAARDPLMPLSQSEAPLVGVDSSRAAASPFSTILCRTRQKTGRSTPAVCRSARDYTLLWGGVNALLALAFDPCALQHMSWGVGGEPALLLSARGASDSQGNHLPRPHKARTAPVHGCSSRLSPHESVACDQHLSRVRFALLARFFRMPRLCP